MGITCILVLGAGGGGGDTTDAEDLPTHQRAGQTAAGAHQGQSTASPSSGMAESHVQYIERESWHLGVTRGITVVFKI